MKRSLERLWLVIGFGMTALLMGWMSATSYQNATQLIESTNKSKQTYEVIRNLADVFATMTVAESGRRGYVFLNDEKERLRYQAAVRQLEPKLQILRQQLTGNPAQMRLWLRLDNLLTRRITLLRWSIQIHQQDPSAWASQVHITNRSIQLRDEIQATINQIQAEEERVLQQWLNQSQDRIHDRLLIESLVTVSSFTILIALYGLLHRQLMKRQRAETMQYKLAQENELSELKLRFFSMVSHEFRTPLSIILGSAQLLAVSSQPMTEERRLKNLARIQSSAKLMTQLLTDILTLSRAEAGKLEFNPKPIDMEAFCLNLIEEIQLSHSSSVPIQFTSQGSGTYAHLDEKLIYAILSNLLSNAIKYAAETSIHFNLCWDTEHIIFTVVNQGPAIPLEEQEKLYQPFYRGQNVGTAAGTGLGLAVVKTCVDRHQGEISIESGVGKGTAFTVKIPQNSQVAH